MTLTAHTVMLKSMELTLAIMIPNTYSREWTTLNFRKMHLFRSLKHAHLDFSRSSSLKIEYQKKKKNSKKENTNPSPSPINIFFYRYAIESNDITIPNDLWQLERKRERDTYKTNFNSLEKDRYIHNLTSNLRDKRPSVVSMHEHPE